MGYQHKERIEMILGNHEEAERKELDEVYIKAEIFNEIDRLMTESYEYYHYFKVDSRKSENKKRELVQIRFAENTAKLLLRLKHESED